MPYCTIEEAWGENIYNTDESKKKQNALLYTDTLEGISESDYLRPKEHSTFIIEEDKITEHKSESKQDLDKEITERDVEKNLKNSEIINLEHFIEKLKKENEELKKVISSKNIKEDEEKNSLKFKLIDILIYILTGIFIIFIIDVIFKNTISKSKLKKNIF
jgi:hypothetical protein